MGGFKGHQTLTSCCDLIIDHREKLLKTFLLEADSSTALENLIYRKHVGFCGNDLDLPRKPEVEFEPPVWVP